MSTPIQIIDGTGSRSKVEVSPNNSLIVSEIPLQGQYQNNNILTLYKAYREYFVNSAGSNSLNVDGSTTAQTFFVNSNVGVILYVTGFKIIMSATGLNLGSTNLKGFSSAFVSGLTNGMLLNISQSGIVTNIFSSPVKTLADLLDYNDDYVNFPGGLGSGVDYLNLTITFEKPIVIPANTFDNITITIRDNLSSFVLFRVIARGYQEIL